MYLTNPYDNFDKNHINVKYHQIKRKSMETIPHYHNHTKTMLILGIS